MKCPRCGRWLDQVERLREDRDYWQEEARCRNKTIGYVSDAAFDEIRLLRRRILRERIYALVAWLVALVALLCWWSTT